MLLLLLHLANLPLTSSLGFFTPAPSRSLPWQRAAPSSELHARRDEVDLSEVRARRDDVDLSETQLGSWSSLLHPQSDRIANIDGHVADLETTNPRVGTLRFTNTEVNQVVNATAIAAVDALWRKLKPEVTRTKGIKSSFRVMFSLINCVLGWLPDRGGSEAH